MPTRKPTGIATELLDQLLDGMDAKTAFEKDGLFDELEKALAERALNAEMDHHLETEGELSAQVRILFRQGQQLNLKLGNPLQSHEKLLFEGADPIHTILDSEVATKRHIITSKPKNYRPQCGKSDSPKGGLGVGSKIYYRKFSL